MIYIHNLLQILIDYYLTFLSLMKGYNNMSVIPFDHVAEWDRDPSLYKRLVHMVNNGHINTKPKKFTEIERCF